MAIPGAIRLVEELFQLERAGHAGVEAGLDHAAVDPAAVAALTPATTASWSRAKHLPGQSGATWLGDRQLNDQELWWLGTSRRR